MTSLSNQSTAALRALIRHHVEGWHHATTDEQVDHHRDIIWQVNAVLNERRAN